MLGASRVARGGPAPAKPCLPAAGHLWRCAVGSRLSPSMACEGRTSSRTWTPAPQGPNCHLCPTRHAKQEWGGRYEAQERRGKAENALALNAVKPDERGTCLAEGLRGNRTDGHVGEDRSRARPSGRASPSPRAPSSGGPPQPPHTQLPREPYLLVFTSCIWRRAARDFTCVHPAT